MEEIKQTVLNWLKAEPRTHEQIADKVYEVMDRSWRAAKEHDTKLLFDILFKAPKF